MPKSAMQQPQPANAVRTKRNNRNNRQSDIVAALRQCILRSGYADTTITDVANEAGLSVSHLLYYYPGKDEILIDLVTDHHSRIGQSIQVDRGEDPLAMIEAMVDQIFVATSAEELALLREIIGLAVHKPQLNAILEEYASAGFRQFEIIFEAAPRQAGLSPADAANLAGALWLGLMIQVDVRTARNESKLRGLFRTALMRLACLDERDPRPLEGEPENNTSNSN